MNKGGEGPNYCNNNKYVNLNLKNKTVVINKKKKRYVQ